MEAKNGFSTVQLLRLSAQGSSAGDRVQRIRDAQYSFFFFNCHLFHLQFRRQGRIFQHSNISWIYKHFFFSPVLGCGCKCPEIILEFGNILFLYPQAKPILSLQYVCKVNNSGFYFNLSFIIIIGCKVFFFLQFPKQLDFVFQLKDIIDNISFQQLAYISLETKNSVISIHFFSQFIKKTGVKSYRFV